MDETAVGAGPVTAKVVVIVTTLPSGLPDAMAVMAVVPGAKPVTTTGVPVTVPCVAEQGPGGAQTVATAGLLEYQLTLYVLTLAMFCTPGVGAEAEKVPRARS